MTTVLLNTNSQISWTTLLACSFITFCAVRHGLAADPASDNTSDRRPTADTLHGKVLCGYQGWFRCPGDGTSDGFLHWSRNARRLTPDTVTVEMWPDMSDYTDSERYPVPGFHFPDGQPATLFSSAHPRTVQRHFRWMRDYGVDGVMVQRFLTELRRSSFQTVLNNVRVSAAETERVYAICYDLSGAPAERLYDLLVTDWKQLVEEQKVTADKNYLHHAGKPVLMIWGFFSDRFEPAVAHRILDFFQHDPRYGVTLIGGCQWYWRREKDVEWARAFRRFDVISPWNVGNYATVNGRKVAATGYWQDDLEEARRAGRHYLPVLYPGFGWTNLKRNVAGEDRSRDTIPRRRGEFLREQFDATLRLGIDMAYVAMFDEVDEGTAVFKVSDRPPREAPFQTLEGLPADYYLKLVGEETTRMRAAAQP